MKRTITTTRITFGLVLGLALWIAEPNLYVSAGTPLLAETNPFGIATIAGTPYDASGDGGPALLAGFGFGSGSVAWRDGNLYVTHGPRVRKINPAGIVTTIAGALDPVVHL